MQTRWLVASAFAAAAFSAFSQERIDIPKGTLVCASEELAKLAVIERNDYPDGCARLGISLQNQEVVAATTEVTIVRMTDGRRTRVRYVVNTPGEDGFR